MLDDPTGYLSFESLHTLTFWILYAGAALATFVVVERAIFFWRTSRMSRMLLAAVHDGDRAGESLSRLLDQRSVPTNAVRDMLSLHLVARSRSDNEDAAEAIFLASRSRFARHLWILDTIVTAAPLLGLLGTILGIIDTFVSLAQSGISDPAGVSAGIGTALYATALGISVALYGLVFHNLFSERIRRASDDLKILLIRAGRPRPSPFPPAGKDAGITVSSAALEAASA